MGTGTGTGTGQRSCLPGSKMSYSSREWIKAGNTVEINNRCGGEKMMKVQRVAQEIEFAQQETAFYHLYILGLKNRASASCWDINPREDAMINGAKQNDLRWRL